MIGSLGTFFHRNKILQAAAEVFTKRGARAATVEEILRAASVSRRTFYRFFRSKDDVLASLYEVSCKLVLDAVQKAAGSTRDPMTKLERCVDAYLAFNRSDGDLMRVLEAEALRPDSPLQKTRGALLDELEAVIAAHLQETQGRRADPLVLRGLLLALEGISQRVHAEGEVTDKQLARARKAMLRILLGTLARDGDPVPPLPLG